MVSPSTVLRLREEIPAYYFVFDLIACEGYDLRQVTLEERNKILRALLPESTLLRYGEAVSGLGRIFLRLACEKGLEGIVAKDSTSSYRSQRSLKWQKVKCVQQQEFVIGGYTFPSRGRRPFGALLLGLFEDKKLTYVGKTGSGFGEETLRQVYRELKRRKRKTNPFHDLPKEVAAEAWVTPKLVCEVRFSEWTRGGLLRVPIFLGLRPDVDAQECRREVALGREEKETPGAPLPYDFLSNLDKVFWPSDGYTKRDLLEFYHNVADLLLPYLKDRPMVLERFPDGIEGKSFYQKEAPEFLPEWVSTVAIKSESTEKTIHYLLCQDRPTLVYLTNLACISQHPWSSRVETLQNPDFLIIDLDPDQGISFSKVCQVALKVREVIESVEMSGYPKTSGASGIHILIPLKPDCSYENVRTFAEIIARLTVDGLEEIATFERSSRKRRNKIYVDFLQNGWGKTIASPYSVRPRPGATVSTPLEWKEVSSSLRPGAFHIKNIFRRLERKGDLFEGVLKDKRSLREALKKLQDRWPRKETKS